MLGRPAAGLLCLGSMVTPDWSGAGSFLWVGEAQTPACAGRKQLAIPWAGEDVR